MKKEETSEPALRSDEVQEIISHVPGWISRFGIMVILMMLICVLVLSWFIKYPDIIKANVVITTTPPPLTLVSRSAGNIKIFIPENRLVKSGDIVATLESNTELSSVLALEKFLAAESQELTGYDKHWKLGDLQPGFTAYLNAMQALHNFRLLDIHSKQIRHLSNQLASYRKLNTILSGQLELMKQELAIALKKFQRDSLLYTQQVISAQDFNGAEATWLEERRAFKSAEANVASNEIQSALIQKSIAELEAQQHERETEFRLAVENTRRELTANIAKWKESFAFVAPSAGTLAYLEFVENDMFVENGKALFSVIPDTDQIYAQASIPITGSGKAKAGQEVNIMLDNYPHQQFGMIRGKVIEISELPSDKNYLAKIAISPSLVTTYNKKLPFRQQLQGQTEIITEDLRVLERLFYQFRTLFKNN